jgi:hypothetical protein
MVYPTTRKQFGDRLREGRIETAATLALAELTSYRR